MAGSNVRFRETFTALLIGMFVNNVMPARMGEVARGYVLSHKRGSPSLIASSTVLLDRFFDLTGLLLMMLIFFPRCTLPPAISKAIWMVIGMVLFCVILIILLSRPAFAGRLAARLTSLERSFLSKFGKRIIEIQENLSRIGSPFKIVCFVAVSFCIWFSMATALWFVARALQIPVDIRHIAFVCALLNVGITVPSSPGYVGLYQFLLVYLLSIFGVPKFRRVHDFDTLSCLLVHPLHGRRLRAFPERTPADPRYSKIGGRKGMRGEGPSPDQHRPVSPNSTSWPLWVAGINIGGAGLS